MKLFKNFKISELFEVLRVKYFNKISGWDLQILPTYPLYLRYRSLIVFYKSDEGSIIVNKFTEFA